HPNGVILVVGLMNSILKVLDVKNASCLANFEGHKESGSGPINCLSSIQNRYSLETISTQSTMFKLWDLRRPSNYHSIELADYYKPRRVKWDYSGQFISAFGDYLRVWQNKTWKQFLRI
ncbi:hypothetical protein PPACK8108_LOCUS1004, partial [Phakopsora pachyrhizi]